MGLRRGGPRLQRGVGAPGARHAHGALALDDELRLDQRGVGMVEVAPALAPHLGATRPPPAVAGQQHLEALCEARLPRPVAPHDEGEAGPGLEAKRGLGPDAAEALHGDRAEVRAGRLGGGIRGIGRRGGRLVPGRAENLLEALHALARGDDEQAPLLGEDAVVLQPLIDDPLERVLHAASSRVLAALL